MTARARVMRARRLLALGVGAGAVAWGVAAGLALLLLAALVDRWLPLSTGVRGALPAAATAAGLAAAAWVVWRIRRMRRLERVALWVEERMPALRYALVTSLESFPGPALARLEAQVASVGFEPVVRRRAARAAIVPALTALLALAVLTLLPDGMLARVTAPRPGDALLRRPADPGNALAVIAVTVEPPAYAGVPRSTQEDPARVAALVGSRVRIEGRAAGNPVEAGVDGRPVPVTAAAERWSAALTMGSAPEVVRLRQDGRERLLLLEPRSDSVPVVTLEAPARDTVLRTAEGTVPLRAAFRDDFGLAETWWELVVSSGEGENYQFRTVVQSRGGMGGARAATRTGRLALESLGLGPGDLVHLRAVARDRNTVSGPGVGGSETRTIRIARAGEYDSLAVEGMPPGDTLGGLLSQRMLILLTEALERRRPRLPRDELLAESGRIGRDQSALRRRVGDLIFSRLEDPGGGSEHSHDDGHDHGALTPEELLREADEATASSAEPLDFAGGESPVVAINRPLLEAYNAMWSASRELGVGETRRALPHMYAALAAIQRARQAERFYLRGRVREAVVDLARVRLAGKKEGIAPGPRAPRTAEDEARAARAARLDAAVARLAAEPGPALDSLLLLRAELLGADPGGAGPLGEAIAALRAGRDATAPLVAARRALAGARGPGGGLGPWSAVP